MLWSKINSEPRYLFYTHLMLFLMYRDNDSGLRPSSYPYILGRALNQYRINTSVTIYILIICRYVQIGMIVDTTCCCCCCYCYCCCCFCCCYCCCCRSCFSVAAAVAAATKLYFVSVERSYYERIRDHHSLLWGPDHNICVITVGIFLVRCCRHIIL